MARLLVLVMGLSIVAYLGYRTMMGRSVEGNAAQTPKARLDNVHKVANQIEKQQQQAADEALKRATPQE